jgi:8-oxo-dGTP pyrophosphatase MutT (NUDIX family)
MPQKYGPWQIKERQQKYQNEFFEVNEDQVIRPDGQPGTYGTITMKPGVSTLVLDEAGFVYLTRQFRYALGQESIEVATGAIEADEAPLAAARREIREELGIEAEEWLDLGIVNMDTSIIYCPMHLFLAQSLTFNEPDREGTEKIETIKLPLAEAAQMVMESTITHGSSSVLILKASGFLQKSPSPFIEESS